MSTTENKTQSRWGFHPCDYSLFLKLRFLHKWYWQTLYDFHRWHRWYRKQEETRVGAEPRFCPIFVQPEVWYKPFVHHGTSGFQLYPKKVVDHGIVDLYQRGRMPQTNVVPLFDEATVKRIEELYSTVEQYVSSSK